MTEAVENKRGIEKISMILNFMIEYTDFHFSTEEKHMTEQDYPGNIDTFLVNWLVNLIKGFDVKFGIFLKTRNPLRE